MEFMRHDGESLAMAVKRLSLSFPWEGGSFSIERTSPKRGTYLYDTSRQEAEIVREEKAELAELTARLAKQKAIATISAGMDATEGYFGENLSERQIVLGLMLLSKRGDDQMKFAMTLAKLWQESDD